MTDLTLLMLRHGYQAVARDRAERGGGRTYRSRMLGGRAIVLGGEEGARLFYDEDVVERAGAIPPPLAWLLFGRGAVHGLDDDEHRARKSLFLGLLGPAAVTSCARDAGARLARDVDAADGRELDVHRLLVEVYGAAVLTWAGVPGTATDHVRRARHYADIVDGFGFAGAAYARAWVARRRTNGWAEGLVDDVRRGRVAVPEATVLGAVAASDLDARTAAVELGNVLRPTVAVSWLGAHAAVALARLGSDVRERLADPGADAERWSFAQEVRRTAPFVPVLAGRARRSATLDGVAVDPGDRLVLDVRGINTDPELHPDPDRFHWDRFLGREPGPWSLVPQGGGRPTGHRCPGESMTLQLLVETTGVLAPRAWRPVGPVDARLTRMPTLPRSGPTVAVARP